jgi:hypothetical protein
MTKLFISPHHGVTAVRTGAAHQADLRLQAFRDSHSEGAEMPNQAALEQLVRSETMTFITPHGFRDESAKCRHTGDYNDLGELMKLYHAENTSFYVPFSSGDLDRFREELEQGYGPKPTLLKRLIEEALNANINVDVDTLRFARMGTVG